MASVQSYARVDGSQHTCTLVQSILFIFNIPKDELLLLEIPCSGPDMSDVVPLIDFLPELHPKSQPGFAPTTPVTDLIPLPAQNHLLTSSLNVFSAGDHICSSPNTVFSRTSPLLHTQTESHNSHISLGFPGLTDQALLAPSQTHIFLSLCHRNPPLHLLQ